MNIFNKKKSKIQFLKLWDVAILALILLGPAIWKSTAIYFQSTDEMIKQGMNFSTVDNIVAIITQSAQLIIAYLYLKIRSFDFSQWKFKITIKGTICAIILFFFLGGCLDIVSGLKNGFEWIPLYLSKNVPLIGAFSEVTISVVFFSVLNGFYEEIFFLGICTAVEAKYQRLMFIVALVLRVSFHTYQGLGSALGIGLILGSVYYVLYRKKTQNLYPYMLSHTFADIFGLSLIHFL